MITLAEILKQGTDRLRESGIGEASLDARYLLEDCFSISRADYLLHWEQEADLQRVAEYKEWIEKRAARQPLQYILGKQEFMGLRFQVTPDVLIPRQDTELLAETVLAYLKNKGEPLDILDLCTGSGCIVISLAVLSDLGRRVGADISAEALAVAKENGERNGVSVEWVQSNMYEHILGCFDIIVSNPPYIESKEIKELMPEVRLYEPELALDGKEDGLFFYRNIVEKAAFYLKRNGAIFLEIGHNQGKAVMDLLKKKKFGNIILIQDLTGLDRVVWGIRD